MNEIITKIVAVIFVGYVICNVAILVIANLRRRINIFWYRFVFVFFNINYVNNVFVYVIMNKNYRKGFKMSYPFHDLTLFPERWFRFY